MVSIALRVLMAFQHMAAICLAAEATYMVCLHRRGRGFTGKSREKQCRLINITRQSWRALKTSLLANVQMLSMINTEHDKWSLFGQYRDLLSISCSPYPSNPLRLSVGLTWCNCMPAGCKRRALPIKNRRSLRSRRR